MEDADREGDLLEGEDGAGESIESAITIDVARYLRGRRVVRRYYPNSDLCKSKTELEKD